MYGGDSISRDWYYKFDIHILCTNFEYQMQNNNNKYYIYQLTYAIMINILYILIVTTEYIDLMFIDDHFDRSISKRLKMVHDTVIESPSIYQHFMHIIFTRYYTRFKNHAITRILKRSQHYTKKRVIHTHGMSHGHQTQFTFHHWKASIDNSIRIMIMMVNGWIMYLVTTTL